MNIPLDTELLFYVFIIFSVFTGVVGFICICCLITNFKGERSDSRFDE